MTQPSSRICILGGGFGGLYTALRLSTLAWDKPGKPEIVLIDQRDRFLFAPLLYELLTGELQTWEIAPPYTELLANTGIRFHQAQVSSLDLEARQVHLQGGEALTYDRLVLAMGGDTPMDAAPGVAEHAIPFRTIADAYRLEDRLRPLEQSERDKIRVAIVGAGYSGVELACKLAERLGDRGRIRLVERGDQILRNSPTFNREAATSALQARNVWTDLETGVVEVTDSTIALDFKGQVDTIPVDVVLWTVGTKIAEIVQTLPVKHNDRGQVMVTSTLQLVDHADIFALGDLADCQDADGQKVPTTAQSAFQQADYAGWNIWASLSDRP
ncbi:MAG TPA: NAD(P)/FAD-dependent oxidoreductase, partial [Chroococcidiopsis sp.]